MTPKLYKAADVCELAQLQPYVLRSWEKEFPGIGVQKSQDSPRLYRQSDLDQVLRIKQLVFGEGLTLSGARRRLEESAPVQSAASQAAAAQDLVEAIGADARARIAHVRDGLRSLLSLLSAPANTGSNGAGPTLATPGADDYRLEPPVPPSSVRRMADRSTASTRKTGAVKTDTLKRDAVTKSASTAKRKRVSA